MKFRIVISIFTCLIFSLVIITSEAAFDPETLVGAWLFDEGKGDVAEDSSGSGLDGASER